MPCEVKNCSIDDERLTYRCYGACGKEFHAACAGARRNYEAQIRAYMLPLCEDCQEEFTSIIKLRKLFERQRSLSDDIEAANNKICSFINTFNVREAFESLESNLFVLRDELKRNDCNAAHMINNVSSMICDNLNTATLQTSMQHANEALANKISLSVEHGFSTFEGQLKNVQAGLAEVSARECPKFPACEILEEVKLLSSAVAAIQPADIEIAENIHHVTLADELAQDLARARLHRESLVVDSGWRLLGARKVWKNDWTEYDSRQLRRRQL